MENTLNSQKKEGKILSSTNLESAYLWKNPGYAPDD